MDTAADWQISWKDKAHFKNEATLYSNIVSTLPARKVRSSE